MGCGHSKINIYPRKSRSKSNSKKAVTPEKTESEEEEGIENDELENNENLEDCDSKKTIKVKPFGGPLLAQTDISSSQQDFFKMLDDKIQNGPDYNSESEIEKAAEAARLSALLKDWETASAGSRSLPATPKRRSKPAAAAAAALAEKLRPDGVRSADVSRAIISDRNYVTQIPQSVIHQSYGITQVPYSSGRQINYSSPLNTNNPNYIGQTQSHQIPSYPSAMQYQAISPMYTSQPTYQPPPLPRQYPSYNQHGSPIKTCINNTSSPKHIPYDHHYHQQSSTTFTSISSPSHKLYGPPVPPPAAAAAVAAAQQQPIYSNGEFLQQQFYNQQMQYQQYKEAREQVLAQNQQQQHLQQQQPVQTVVGGGGGYRRNYQTSVTIPIVVQNQSNDMNNALHRKQYELT